MDGIWVMKKQYFIKVTLSSASRCRDLVKRSGGGWVWPSRPKSVAMSGGCDKMILIVSFSSSLDFDFSLFICHFLNPNNLGGRSRRFFVATYSTIDIPWSDWCSGKGGKNYSRGQKNVAFFTSKWILRSLSRPKKRPFLTYSCGRL